MKIKNYDDFCKLFDSRHHMFEQTNLLNETLKTYPIDTIIDKVSHSTFAKHLNISVTKNVYKNIAYVNCDSDSMNLDLIQFLKVVASQRGYFISHVEYWDGSQMIILKNFDDETILLQAKLHTKAFNVVFESRYNTVFKLNQRFLYHCTTEAILPKILKNGLLPKSREKATKHPERIYFALDDKTCEELILQFLKDADEYKEGDTEFIKLYKEAKRKFVILQIDTEKLPDVEFMEDPNCKDYWGVFGIYTVDSVPPSAIKIYKNEN